jgi:ATP-dependent DNA ligase
MPEFTVNYGSKESPKKWKAVQVGDSNKVKIYINGKLSSVKEYAATTKQTGGQRAKSMALSLYLAKKKNTTTRISGMIRPMLAKNVRTANIVSLNPADYVLQPKLDGNRALIHNIGHAQMYSRGRNEILMPHLTTIFDKIYKQPGVTNWHFDLELYRHGMSLQQIGSDVRKRSIDRKRKSPIAVTELPSSRLQAHVFDYYDPTNNEPFGVRHEKLKSVISKAANDYVKLVPTHKLKTIADITRLNNKYVKDGYEGIILRELHSKYHTGSKRSNALIKMKHHQDSEYKLVDFTTGTGKHKEVPVLIFELPNKKRFKAKAPLSMKQSKELLADLRRNFSKYKKKYTIRYEALSDTGIPLRALVVSIN